MAGTILTPMAIWRNFKIQTPPVAQELDKTKVGTVTYTRLKIQGRAVDGEAVSIYAKMAKGKVSAPAPAILFVHDFDENCDALLEELSKKGYIVLSVDLAGEQEGKEFYTQYPKSISYANFEQVKSELTRVVKDVGDTCWYEWAAVLRYALAYLKSLDEVSFIGGLGVGEAATALWQVAGMDENLDCVCFALNAGWRGYQGIYRFAGTVEPQFSENMYKFIAGIEPQAYAMHVKCPTLVLSATNSDIFDGDRAYDTIARISEAEYKAVHYSVGYINGVSGEAYQNALIFFDEFLKKSQKGLPGEIDIKCDLDSGKIKFEILPDTNGLKELALYVSEEQIKPSLRAWKKITEYKEIKEDGTYVFEYSPYPESGLVIGFAKAEYKSGFSLGSNVVAKRFCLEEVTSGYKSNIIYSSRIAGAESVFTAENQTLENLCKISCSDKKLVKVKKGAMGIEGAGCERGLMTFKVNSLKDRPKEDAILMFDVCAEQGVSLTVKLIADYFGNKIEYQAVVKTFGGEVWHNVKLTRNKFKTVEGMSLKSYEKINAIAFTSEDGDFLINNALWV